MLVILPLVCILVIVIFVGITGNKRRESGAVRSSHDCNDLTWPPRMLHMRVLTRLLRSDYVGGYIGE